MANLELIDGDGHILEPPDMWQRYIEPKYREVAPRVGLCEGAEAWFVEDHLIHEARREDKRGLGYSGAVGRSLAEVQAKGLKYLNNPAGAFYPADRIKVLDAEGISRAVLYPTTCLFVNRGRIKDPGLVTAACRAYNDWMADFCKTSPRRLYGAAAIPLHDVKAAVAELNRATKLGLRAAFIRPASHLAGLPFADACYDPFWAAAQELGTPVALHPAIGDDMPGAARHFNLFGELPSKRRPGMGTLFSQGLGNPVDMIISLGWFIYGGVLERFPRLKVVILESSGGWIQPILERMDHHIKTFKHESKHLKSTATEYFRRQMWISFDPDEAMIGVTAQLVGDDHIIWASDFPHPDAKYPSTGDELRKHLGGLPQSSQQRIAGENCIALYGLEKAR